MHGWGGSGAYFDETLAHLDPTRARAVTFDFAGHGGSHASHAEPTLDRLAAETIAVADAVEAAAFVLPLEMPLELAAVVEAFLAGTALLRGPATDVNRERSAGATAR
jgi:pimeloyl-ACP methyl ester carboxylesterase